MRYIYKKTGMVVESSVKLDSTIFIPVEEQNLAENNLPEENPLEEKPEKEKPAEEKKPVKRSSARKKEVK